MRERGVAAAFFALAGLAGCAQMPHPFADPGHDARDLALNTPPPRLAVPVPAQSLLDDKAAALLAQDTATALLAQSIPAIVQAPRAGDWSLKITASLQGGLVAPRFAILTPKGEEKGHVDALPVPGAAGSAGDAKALDVLAAQEAPHIAQRLTDIQTAMMLNDPSSLMRRPARLYFSGVTGAPGDGNVSLARAFAAALPDARDQLQPAAKGADYTIRSTVSVTDGPAGTTGHPQQHVEIVWHVLAADGKEAGAATQLHDVDAHSLDGPWGDVAAAAAGEAAGGVRQIVSTYSGRDHKLPPDQPAEQPLGHLSGQQAGHTPVKQ
jgi:hypothetical protein